MPRIVVLLVILGFMSTIQCGMQVKRNGTEPKTVQVAFNCSCETTKLKNQLNNAKYKIQNLEDKFEALENKSKQQFPLIPTTTSIPELPMLTNNTQRHSNLTAVTATMLQHPLWYSSSVYDRNDCIYIFGGLSSLEEGNAIYRFNITSEVLMKVATFPMKIWGGSTAIDFNGNIYYFGGLTGPDYTVMDKVFKFDPTKNTVAEVEQLDNYFVYGEALTTQQNPGVILLIDGYTNGSHYVRSFDTNSLKSYNLGVLNNSFKFSSAFVFGDQAIIISSQRPEIEILNLKNFTTVLKKTQLPKFRDRPSVVSDGTYGYIIGGYRIHPTSNSNALIRFDPTTLKHEFIHVDNCPGAGDGFFEGMSAVYVEKRNRIYIIGGTLDPYSEHHEKISYIDLSPLNQLNSTSIETSDISGSSCLNKTNGFYPYSTVQKNKFISCVNGNSETFVCPPPLSFDVGTSSCNYPTVEDKNEVNCDGKLDGFYPHPENCEMFLGCLDGFMDIFKCPKQLRFDSATLKCNFPEIVTCGYDST